MGEYKNFHGDPLLDKILREHYFPDYSYKGFFLDIGAFEPIRISNSYHFEQNGWTVYCIEANPENCDKLKTLRKNVFNVAVADICQKDVNFTIVETGVWTASFSALTVSEEYKQQFRWNPSFKHTTITVDQVTVDSILQDTVQQIDIVSLDIEGGELAALKGFNLEKYKPKVLVIESVNETFNKPLDLYMSEHNYKLDMIEGWNRFYVPLNFAL